MKITRPLLSNQWFKLLTAPAARPQSLLAVTENSLSDPELKDALTILSLDKNKNKLLFKSLNQDLSLLETRNRYIDQLANIMNDLNLPKDRNLPMLEQDHFKKIVDGLTVISNTKFNAMAELSYEDLSIIIRNITSEQQLLEFFDNLYYTGKISAKMAIEILLNKNLTNIELFTHKILNPNKYIRWSKRDYVDFEFSLLQKYYQCMKFDKIKNLIIFYSNNEYWIQTLRNNQVSPVAERTFWKFCLIFEDVETTFNILKRINNNKSNWLFLESFMFYAKSKRIDDDTKSTTFNKILKFLKVGSLSKEQAILLEFLSNELVRNSINEISSIITISLTSRSSSPSFKTNKLLRRELSRKLFDLQQKYEDFDLTQLHEALNEFENEMKIEENDKSTKVIELVKLFEF